MLNDSVRVASAPYPRHIPIIALSLPFGILPR
jgi:hypothetical protein